MSGASALAAAKRRRAVPTEPSRPSFTPKIQTESSRQPQNQLQSQVQTPLQAQSPLHLLIQHEQKLKDLEHTFSQIQLNEPKANSLSPDTLLYFKTQHDLMSQELNDLKKVLMKIQTFSMETNLELLKLKKQLKLSESTEITENIT
jgi:hypothetical protein